MQMQIERQGVLKGYVRLDEVWQYVSDILARSDELQQNILELTGFDIDLFERQLADTSYRAKLGISKTVAAAEFERIYTEMKNTAVCVLVHRYFLSGVIKIWHQPASGAERYLTTREFSPSDGGSYTVYGQDLNAAANDTPCHSWQVGYASLGETNSTLTDCALYGKTLMISEPDFNIVKQSVTALTQARVGLPDIGSNIAVPSDTALISTIHQMRGEGGLSMSMDSCIDALLVEHPSLKRDSLRELDRIAYPDRRPGRKRGQTAKLIREKH